MQIDQILGQTFAEIQSTVLVAAEPRVSSESLIGRHQRPRCGRFAVSARTLFCGAT
jgi:hypothetical protein